MFDGTNHIISDVNQDKYMFGSQVGFVHFSLSIILENLKWEFYHFKSSVHKKQRKLIPRQ